MKNIDKTAIIKSPCKIDNSVHIGAYSIIGPNVQIGKNTWIDSHVIIQGECFIGNNNKFFKFSNIGDEPQTIKNKNIKNSLFIGHNNIFREGTSVHKGTTRNNGLTSIGNNNYFMVNSHIAHDCLLGNNITFANNVSIAGHVTIGDFVNLSGFVGIHQYVCIGDYSFAAGGSIIYKDIFPFTLVAGYPAKTRKLNLIGLKRQNFKKYNILYLKKIYKLIFKSNLTINQIINYLNTEKDTCKEKEIIIKFLKLSKRGITR